MTAIRSFIALDLDASVQSKLGNAIRMLSPAAGKNIRWVPENNIHITLKFLGDTSPENLEILKNIVTAEASHVHPFVVKIGNLGAFPSIRKTRVVWIGLDAPPELHTLQHAIDIETNRLGYPSEDRPFSPHLTLGRISQHALPEEIRRIGDFLATSQIKVDAVASIRTVVLFRSNLLPGGPVYTPLYIANLK
ncbi:MAG TPA: RNA 2',3'-cyclic phosphodiesterase [Longilinea sp.]|nr:RNA 2',3'-cyclic phosphodiesterase [Longilinea sp.]